MFLKAPQIAKEKAVSKSSMSKKINHKYRTKIVELAEKRSRYTIHAINRNLTLSRCLFSYIYLCVLITSTSTITVIKIIIARIRHRNKKKTAESSGIGDDVKSDESEMSALS